MTIDVRDLFVAETYTALLARGLAACVTAGLSVLSWRVGDPSHTLLAWLAEMIAERDLVAAEFFKAGFLRSATGSWKTLVAQDVFGVTRGSATYATPTVTLSNAGGGVYNKAAGEVIVKSSSSGVTYRSTAALSLASGPGTSATLALVCDEAGSAGTCGVDEVDEIVSTMLGVTITASTAAIGIDEQSDASLEEECLSTLGALSANGPPDAYNAVALNSALTGTTDVTRSTTSESSATGAVTQYVAGASGAVSAGVVDAVQDAIETWATPATITPTVASATNAAQTVAYTISGDDIPATAEDDIEDLVIAYFAELPIGGYVSTAALIALAYDYLVAAGASNVQVLLTSPAGGTLSNGYVATLATCTVTEV